MGLWGVKLSRVFPWLSSSGPSFILIGNSSGCSAKFAIRMLRAKIHQISVHILCTEWLSRNEHLSPIVLAYNPEGFGNRIEVYKCELLAEP